MARKFKVKAPKDPAGIDDTFKQDVDSCSAEQLKAKIVTIQQQQDEAERFMKEKEEIVKLKEELKLAMSGPRETIKHLKNRTRYILQRLRDMGAQ